MRRLKCVLLQLIFEMQNTIPQFQYKPELRDISIFTVPRTTTLTNRDILVIDLNPDVLFGDSPGV
jgi:hypothetical protein